MQCKSLIGNLLKASISNSFNIKPAKHAYFGGPNTEALERELFRHCTGNLHWLTTSFSHFQRCSAAHETDRGKRAGRVAGKSRGI